MYRRTCRTAAPRVHGKVVRDGEDRFHEEDLGPVTFVPLIGAAGWAEPAVDAAPAFERDCGPEAGRLRPRTLGDRPYSRGRRAVAGTRRSGVRRDV
jgi:hypothetical protein